MTIRVFGSIMSVGLVGVYIAARWSMPIDWSQIFFAIGLSWLVINGPEVLQRYWLPQQSQAVSFWLVIGLITFAGAWFPAQPLTPWIISLIGIGCGLLTFLAWWKEWLQPQHRRAIKTRFQLSIVGIILSLTLASWMGMRVWSTSYLTPLFLETVATAAAHSDTLFHLSLSNMWRYYSFPSTGVDGLAFLPYHSGSHLLFASWSQLLNLPTSDFYHLVYPVVFFPVLTVGVLTVALQLAQWQTKNAGSKQHFGPWFGAVGGLAVLTLGLIDIVPSSIQAQLGSSPVIFLSESYTVALVASVWLASLVIDIAKSLRSSQTPWLIKLNWLIVIGSLCLAIGFTKISQLFMILALMGFWLFRFRFLRQPLFLAGIAVLGLLSGWLFLQIRLVDHAATWQLGHYVTQVVHSSWLILWPALGFTWLWAYIGLRVTVLRHLIRDWWDIGLLGWMVGVGLVPGLLLALPGANANYFVDPARWVVLVAGLGLTMRWLGQRTETEGIDISNRLHHWFFVPIFLTIFIVILNYLSTLSNFITHTDFRRQAVLTQLGTYNISASPAASAQLVWSLYQLSRQPHSSTTAGYAPRSSTYWTLSSSCQTTPLIWPALAGYALLDGLPEADCNYELNAYRLYGGRGPRWQNAESAALCRYAKQRGFSFIFIVD